MSKLKEKQDDEHTFFKATHIFPEARLTKFRLIFRWSRFAFYSFLCGYFDFVVNAIGAEFHLFKLWLIDVLAKDDKVACNICGWKGKKFYPNVGSGYYELETTCPKCLCIDRYRSLALILHNYTNLFDPDKEVIEVAPVRSFQQYCQEFKGYKNYLSFDITRYAMEKGDLTQMRYSNASADYFICFHVLEHIQDDKKALDEIYRVLRPESCAIIQVPMDWQNEKTIEYNAPDPRDAGHMRKYGKDFLEKVSACGFQVTCVSVSDFVMKQQIKRYGLSIEPILLAGKLRC